MDGTKFLSVTGFALETSKECPWQTTHVIRGRAGRATRVGAISRAKAGSRARAGRTRSVNRTSAIVTATCRKVRAPKALAIVRTRAAAIGAAVVPARISSFAEAESEDSASIVPTGLSVGLASRARDALARLV